MLATAVATLALPSECVAATTQQKTFAWTGRFRDSLGPHSSLEGAFKVTIHATVQKSLGSGESWYRQYSIDSVEFRIPLTFRAQEEPLADEAPPPPPLVEDYLVVLESSDFDLRYSSAPQSSGGSFVTEASTPSQGYGLYIYLSHPRAQVLTTPAGATLTVGGASAGELAAFVLVRGPAHAGVSATGQWPSASDFRFPPGYAWPYYPRMPNFDLQCIATDDDLTYQRVRFLDAEATQRFVVGAAADGVSRVVVEVHDVKQEAVVAMPDADGTWVSPPTLKGGIWRRTWQAPVDYAPKGLPHGEGRRPVRFSITVDGQVLAAPPFELYQAPVLLLHGIWDDGIRCWAWFARELRRGGFPLVRYPPPSYPSAASFDENRDVPEVYARALLDNLVEFDRVVAKKVDIVAHSMGGCLAKRHGNADYIRKLVTIGTPHSGTRLADKALNEFPFSLLSQWYLECTGRPTTGALRDLRVEGGKHVNGDALGVPVLAVNVIADPSTVPEDFLPEPKYCPVTADHLYRLLYRLLHIDPASTYRTLFDTERSDWTVPERSQKGGLAAPKAIDIDARPPEPPMWHCTETKDPRVLDRVVRFLTEPVAASISIPQPAGEETARPTFEPASARLSSPNARDPKLDSVRISLAEGSGVVRAGGTAHVRCEPSTGVNAVWVGLLGGPLINAPPPLFECAVSIPPEAIGGATVVALGTDSQGVVAFGRTVIDVECAAAVTNLQVWPLAPLYLSVGERCPLQVDGLFTDGLRRNITAGKCGTVYAAGKANVATVSVDGDVTAKEPGFCFIDVHNGVSQQIPLLVNPPTAPVGSSVSLTNVNYAVSEAGVTVKLNVLRSGELTATGRVDYATVDGSALSPGDYRGTNGTLVFRPGQAVQTIAIALVNDSVNEADESFVVRLLNPRAGLRLGALSEATVTILDNDPGGDISFAAATYTVSEAKTTVAVGLRREKGSAGAVGVIVCTGNATATAGTDYIGLCTNVVFQANESTKTVTVPILNDCLAEGSETVLLSLRDPSGGGRLGGRSQAVLSITDDDVAGAIGFSAKEYRVTEDGGHAAVVVTRTGGAACNASVDFTATGGTAKPGEDFDAVSANLVFGANQMRLTNLVRIRQDLRAEGNETVSLKLANPRGGAALGSVSNAWLTIADDESSVAFTNANYAVSEAGATLKLNVVRSGVLTATGRVDYATGDGSARSPGDYRGTNGTLVFKSGQSAQTIAIPLANDTINETNESFVVRLLNARDGMQLGTLSQTAVTILDNDPAGEISFAAATYTVSEAKATAAINLQRLKGSASGVGVSVCTANGTATAGSDYVGLCTNLVFQANETAKTVTVPILNDSLAEGSETVWLWLRDPNGGGQLGTRSNAVLTITDDEFSVRGIYRGSGSLSFHHCANPGSNLSSLVEGEIELFDVAPNRFEGQGALIARYGPSTVVSFAGTADRAGNLAGTYDSDISAGRFTATLKNGRLLFSVKGQPTSRGCLVDCSLTATNSLPSGGGFAPQSLRGLIAEIDVTNATGRFPPPGQYRMLFSPTGYGYVVTDLGGSLEMEFGLCLYSKTGPNSGAIWTSDMDLGLATTGTLIWAKDSAGSFTRQDVRGQATQRGVFAVLESHPLAASAIRHVSPASSPAVPASAAPVPPGAEPEMLDGELPDPGFFLLLPPVRGTPGGVEVCWRSVADRLYALERSTNLSAVPCFVPLQPGVVGLTNTTCFTDRTATNQVPYFYRVRTDQ